MSPQLVRHKIVVPAETDKLSELRDHLSRLCEDNAVPPKVTRRMVLAIDEALANIIEHGQLPADDGAIELVLEMTESHVVAEITDRGIPFDPCPRGSEPDRRHYPRRGFGLYLIHMIVDSIEYRRTPSGCNVLTLTKTIDFDQGLRSEGSEAQTWRD